MPFCFSISLSLVTQQSYYPLSKSLFIGTVFYNSILAILLSQRFESILVQSLYPTNYLRVTILKFKGDLIFHCSRILEALNSHHAHMIAIENLTASLSISIRIMHESFIYRFVSIVTLAVAMLFRHHAFPILIPYFCSKDSAIFDFLNEKNTYRFVYMLVIFLRRIYINRNVLEDLYKQLSAESRDEYYLEGRELVNLNTKKSN